jgi:hypothetical protein
MSGVMQVCFNENQRWFCWRQDAPKAKDAVAPRIVECSVKNFPWQQSLTKSEISLRI